jgi:hypothetical protein
LLGSRQVFNTFRNGNGFADKTGNRRVLLLFTFFIQTTSFLLMIFPNSFQAEIS